MDPDGRGDPARPDGRLRSGGRVLAWAPGLVDPAAGSAAGSAGGLAADSDDACEAGTEVRRRRPATLGDLDLVVTPISVTPPRAWRRAAWFAVAAACVVLVGLVVATARLAGGPFDRLDAFPGLPTGGLLTAQPIGPPVHPPLMTTEAGWGDSSSPGGRPGAAPGGTGAGGSRGDDRSGGPGLASSSRTDSPTGGRSRGQSAPPTVSVLPTTGNPPVAADDLVAGTTAFYDQLPNNIGSAWAMVGPEEQAQGYDAFSNQWADVAEVQLREVVVNANDSVVLATVRMVTNGGVERVDRYRLFFHKADQLVIDEITPIGGGGKKEK